MRRLLALIVLVGIALGGAAYWWLHQPLDVGPEPLELAIEPGTTPRGVARDVVAAGVKTDARLLYAWFRVSGQDRAIKAGNYEIPPGTTPISLLQKLARGEEALARTHPGRRLELAPGAPGAGQGGADQTRLLPP